MSLSRAVLSKGRGSVKRATHWLRLPLIGAVLGISALYILTLNNGLDWTINQMLVWVAAIAFVVPVIAFIVKRR